MKRAIFAVILVLALVSGFFPVNPVSASTPNPPPGLIPVDIDPYYKSLTGEAAAGKIMADTVAAAPQLAEAVAIYADAGYPIVGDVRPFDADGWRDFTLRAVGGNAEIWVANDLSYCNGKDPRPPHVVTQDQVDYLLNQFNEIIYPSNVTHFGMTDDRDGTGGEYALKGLSWYATDNPQRVMILVYNIVDEGYCDPTYPFYVAGYFWATMNDTFADRNIIHIDSYDWANRIGPDAARPYLYEGTIAHEYEHAIHYDHDADEPSWVDEGLADLSGYLAGYGHEDGHIAYYMMYHRTPLTQWGGGLEDYGESYLFQLYLMENFGGPDFVKALIDEQANGIAGIENQLGAYSTSFNDIYRDWTLANYLDQPDLTGSSGARLGYESLEIPSEDTQGFSIQWAVENVYGSDHKGNLPIPRYWGGYKSGTVQWPADMLPPYTPMYLSYKGYAPQFISSFLADNTTGVAAPAGEYQLWGGRGDLLFNTATLAEPLLLGANASLSFSAWYEIEALWDFAFVQISTDDGATWTSLANEYTTADAVTDAHPDVLANVPGFTGSSSGWTAQSFDLSAYEGQTVLLRFLYVTDWATNEAGFYADEITVADDSGVLFYDGLEAGSESWALGGFVRTTGLVENDWELSFINPTYEKGKFKAYEIIDSQTYVADPYQRDLTVLDTQSLNKDQVTVVVSNHLPEDMSYPAFYQILVSKGNAR